MQQFIKKGKTVRPKTSEDIVVHNIARPKYHMADRVAQTDESKLFRYKGLHLEPNSKRNNIQSEYCDTYQDACLACLEENIPLTPANIKYVGTKRATIRRKKEWHRSIVQDVMVQGIVDVIDGEVKENEYTSEALDAIHRERSIVSHMIEEIRVKFGHNVANLCNMKLFKGMSYREIAQTKETHINTGIGVKKAIQKAMFYLATDSNRRELTVGKYVFGNRQSVKREYKRYKIQHNEKPVTTNLNYEQTCIIKSQLLFAKTADNKPTIDGRLEKYSVCDTVYPVMDAYANYSGIEAIPVYNRELVQILASRDTVKDKPAKRRRYKVFIDGEPRKVFAKDIAEEFKTEYVIETKTCNNRSNAIANHEYWLIRKSLI